MPVTAEVNIARMRLVFDEPDDSTVTVGVPELLLDGEPFPWATIGPYRLEYGSDDVATLTISLPVKVER